MRLRLSANSEDLMATQYDRKAEDLGNVVMLLAARRARRMTQRSV
jgi:hypothetical protein